MHYNLTSKKGHSSFWFSVPGCAQVLADAVKRPVCYYPSPRQETAKNKPVTFLPIEVPDHKPEPLVLQKIGHYHWGAVEINDMFDTLPHVYSSFSLLDHSHEKFEIPPLRRRDLFDPTQVVDAIDLASASGDKADDDDDAESSKLKK